MNEIASTYRDTWGVEHTVPLATIERFRAVLDAGDRAASALEPIVMFHEGRPQRVPVVLNDRDDRSYTLMMEDGARHVGTAEIVDGTFTAPVVLPLGYHRLTLADSTTTLAVVPERGHLARGCNDGERGVWGVAVQLYALRSSTDWGIGDFTGLRSLVEIAKAAGASAVGLNPLHALPIDEPDAASPYSPASRLFLNDLYIDVMAIDDVAKSSEARNAIAAPAFAAELARLRAEPYVDYASVARAKRTILDVGYRAFRAANLDVSEPTVEGAKYRTWLAAKGQTLEDFATYEALREHFSGDHRGGWREWPEAYHDPRSDTVAAFRDMHRKPIEYHAWVQWHAERQFSAASDAARSMAVGLYRDVAVGADGSSADVWLDRGAYILDASVGAPPDELNTQGQDWGLPPIDPGALRERAYAPFVELLRANMQGAGALRIDHAMSLMRLFWIPRGEPAASGAYIAYPFDEMLGILALESRRAQCMVIGEDLGTVPPGFRERMAATGVLSYRLLFFEREFGGAFFPPERYPALALVTGGTHDLATIAGYATARDIDARAKLGMTKIPGEAQPDYDERLRDRATLLEALVTVGTLAPHAAQALPYRRDGEARTDAFDPLVLAAYRFLARTPGALVMVSLDDALGELDQVNLPGTSFQYPNWRRKLGCEIERLAGDRRFTELASMLREEGRSA